MALGRTLPVIKHLFPSGSMLVAGIFCCRLWESDAQLLNAACRLNSAEMFVDVTKDSSSASTNWVAESGVLDLFFLLGPTPPKVRLESEPAASSAVLMNEGTSRQLITHAAAH